MPAIEINGRMSDFDVADDTPLLWVLRDVAGLTGTKYGCGVALCGCCTVHLDGKPIRSCQTAIGDVAGRKITTIKAIGDTPAGDVPVLGRERLHERLASDPPRPTFHLRSGIAYDRSDRRPS